MARGFRRTLLSLRLLCGRSGKKQGMTVMRSIHNCTCISVGGMSRLRFAALDMTSVINVNDGYLDLSI
jgi:hypothetical protein